MKANNRRIAVVGVAAMAISVACAACGPRNTTQVTPVSQPVVRDGQSGPGWTRRGSYTENRDGHTFVFAVGLDEGLAAGLEESRSSAAAAARDRMAQYIATSVQTFFQRGAVRNRTSGSQGTPSSSSAPRTSGQSVELTERQVSASRQIADETLRGVEIVEYWEDEAHGRVFALAKVDIRQLMGAMSNVPSLSEEDRNRVTQNYDEAVNAMQQALQERAQQVLGGGSSGGEQPAGAGQTTAAPTVAQ